MLLVCLFVCFSSTANFSLVRGLMTSSLLSQALFNGGFDCRPSSDWFAPLIITFCARDITCGESTWADEVSLSYYARVLVLSDGNSELLKCALLA